MPVLIDTDLLQRRHLISSHNLSPDGLEITDRRIGLSHGRVPDLPGFAGVLLNAGQFRTRLVDPGLDLLTDTVSLGGQILRAHPQQSRDLLTQPLVLTPQIGVLLQQRIRALVRT